MTQRPYTSFDRDEVEWEARAYGVTQPITASGWLTSEMLRYHGERVIYPSGELAATLFRDGDRFVLRRPMREDLRFEKLNRARQVFHAFAMLVATGSPEWAEKFDSLTADHKEHA